MSVMQGSTAHSQQDRAGAPGEEDGDPAAAAKGVPSLAEAMGRGSAAVLVAAHHTQPQYSNLPTLLEEEDNW